MPAQPNAQQTHLMAQVQSLMGISTPQQTRSTSNKRRDNNQKRERLPSLHFGNLPDSFYDLDLFKFIQKQGHNVVKALVVQDKATNKNLDYGYAQFKSAAEAEACQKALNNTVIQGRTITVSIQKEQKPNPKANVFARNLPTKLT